MNADGRILIADDEDSLRWVLEKGFRSAGYQVTAVKDGTAALREVEAGPFDLILLDIRMPGMRTSSKMRSKGPVSIWAKAAVPSFTAVTW